jgi:hypothetical protein
MVNVVLFSTGNSVYLIRPARGLDDPEVKVRERIDPEGLAGCEDFSCHEIFKGLVI